MATHILIVDDNSTNLYMLETILKGYGYGVTSAENGKEALEKARLDPPDLIVTDILMPVMDGYALCREWKADDALKEIPFIFYTATYTDPKDEAFALGIGADRFVLKPQEPDDLVAVIQNTLEECSKARGPAEPLGKEMEFLRQHNETLFRKLDQKMSDLETANRELRASGERYRLSFENVSDIICTVGTDLIITDMSPSIRRLMGLTPGDFIGRPVTIWKKFLTRESFERIMENIHRILEGEIIPSTTYEFVLYDGTTVYSDISGAPIVRDGEIVGLISVARDVTGRKRADDKLRESEKRYREMYDFLPIPVYEMDFEANITAANRAIYEIFRGTEEDLQKGINAWQLLSPEDVEKSARNIERLLRGEPVEPTEYTFKRLDGSTFPAVVISGVIYRDDQPVGLRGAVIDLTERKEAERELHIAYEKRKEMEFIVNHSPAVVWLWKAEPGWPVEYVSDSIARYGYTPDDFTSGRVAYASIVHPDDRQRVGDEVERYTKEGRTEYMQEYRILTKSGETRWIDDRTWVRRRPDGAVTHYQGIAVDVTDRRETEEALQDAYRRLDDIIDFLPDATFAVDRGGKVITWNRSMEQVTGVPKEEMIGKGGHEYAVPLYGRRRRILADLIIRPDETFERGHYENIHRHGETMDAESYASSFYGGKGAFMWSIASPLFDTPGNIIGAIESIRDITDRKLALDNLRRAVEATIQVVVSTLEARDPYTAGHQIRVAELARAIAEEMELPQEQINGLFKAASIHDIGKLSIPTEILTKPTILTGVEFALIQEHPQKGYEILKDVESDWPLAEIIHQHHERMDGSGYPRNLKGNEILIEARILAVADVVEAMASHRPYRPSLGTETALNEIAENGGTLYDPAVVAACLRLFREKGYKLE